MTYFERRYANVLNNDLTTISNKESDDFQFFSTIFYQFDDDWYLKMFANKFGTNQSDFLMSL